MNAILIYLFLCLMTIGSHITSNGKTDTLPHCINTRFETLQSIDTNQRQLPDTISKIGIRKNAMHIQEYAYKGQTLYNLYIPTSGKTRQDLLAKGMITIDEPYYDENGKVIILYKRAIEGMFSRASKWIPSSVRHTDVIKVTNGNWYNNKGKFEKVVPLKINNK